MQKWIIAGLIAQIATCAAAQERQFVCVSDQDGTEYRLEKPAEGDEAIIAFNDTRGAAKVFPGLGNLTFMLADEQNVMTFFVKQADLRYSLSVRRPALKNDKGQCQDVTS